MGWNWVALSGVCVLAALHLAGGRARFATAWERPAVLSVASGISVAYAFVQLLPDMAEEQRRFVLARGAARPAWLDQQVYLAALVGLLLAEGVNRYGRRRGAAHFSAQIVQVAVYQFLIGYYTVRLRHPLGLAIGTVAFGAHFLVHDHEIDEAHGGLNHRYGRPILAAAVVLGWLSGSILRLPMALLSIAFAMVAGGILLHSLREGLSSTRAARFGAFVASTLVYSGLLAATLYGLSR